MPFVFKRLALLLSIAAAFAADKPAFNPGPVSSFANKQTNDKVTVAADPYMTGQKIKVAFGKVDPYQNGVLPVLVVIQNDSAAAIRLDHIRAVYNGPQGDRVDATPPGDVRYAKLTRPKTLPTPAGTVILKGKNPLNTWEIEGRAFAAQMLAPGNSASGFFYFETGLQRGATIYLTGMSEAATGKELVFFEVPLATDVK